MSDANANAAPGPPGDVSDPLESSSPDSFLGDDTVSVYSSEPTPYSAPVGSAAASRVLQAVLSKSYTVARVDIRRPAFIQKAEYGNGGLYADNAYQAPSSSGAFGFADASGGRTGARVMLERVWEMPLPSFVVKTASAIKTSAGRLGKKNKKTAAKAYRDIVADTHPFVPNHPSERAITSDFLRRPTNSGNASLCVGANFDVDRSVLDPCLHVDAGPISIGILPTPTLRAEAWISDVIPRGDLALRLRYECPLASYREFYRSPASLMITLHSTGTGLRIRSTPSKARSGIQFEERMLPVGPNAAMNVGGTLEFSQQFPVPEGRDLVRVRLDALGFAAKLP